MVASPRRLVVARVGGEGGWRSKLVGCLVPLRCCVPSVPFACVPRFLVRVTSRAPRGVAMPSVSCHVRPSVVLMFRAFRDDASEGEQMLLLLRLEQAMLV